jgi:predicted nucleotide-binding protein
MSDILVGKGAIEAFLARVPSKALGNHSQLVAYFGYFLTEELGQTDVTPRRIRACYDAALIPTPANITDTIKRSNAFVQTSTGTLLRRQSKASILDSLSARDERQIREVSIAPSPLETAPTRAASTERVKNVVVVHGRDLKLRDSMFQFLRSVGLSPIEWDEAVRRTGRGSPYTGDVVAALFTDAQAVVVLLAPEERVELRFDLRDESGSDEAGWQPRPNVLIEAGMSLAYDEPRTILVQIGIIRLASDLVGRNIVHFEGSSAQRHSLIERLRTAGCSVSTSGSDWLRTGNFEVPSALFNGKRRKVK